MISAWLAIVSMATGLVIFLPMIVNGGAMEFHEHNLFMRWGEFLFCMSGTALGIVGAVKGGK